MGLSTGPETLETWSHVNIGTILDTYRVFRNIVVSKTVLKIVMLHVLSDSVAATETVALVVIDSCSVLKALNLLNGI